VSVISLSGNAVRTTLHQSAPFVTAQRGDIDLSYRRPRRGPRAFRGIENDNEAPDDRGAWGGGGGWGEEEEKRKENCGVLQYCEEGKTHRDCIIVARGAPNASSSREGRAPRSRAHNDIREEPTPRSPRFARKNAQKRNASMFDTLATQH